MKTIKVPLITKYSSSIGTKQVPTLFEGTIRNMVNDWNSKFTPGINVAGTLISPSNYNQRCYVNISSVNKPDISHYILQLTYNSKSSTAFAIVEIDENTPCGKLLSAKPLEYLHPLVIAKWNTDAAGWSYTSIEFGRLDFCIDMLTPFIYKYDSSLKIEQIFHIVSQSHDDYDRAMKILG